MKQLSLFEETQLPDVPETIVKAIAEGAALAISISGGKDSQAMLNWLVHLRRQHGWSNNCFAIHAHLGRAEWPQTLPHCQQLCDQAGIPLVVVRRQQGDLVDRWQERMEKLIAEGNSKPFWSSATNRYCTSDLKRGPIDKYLRKFNCIISAEGVRAQESLNRARQAAVSMRASITSKRIQELEPKQALLEWQGKGRIALTWRPLHHWNIERVWEWCSTSIEEYKQRVKLYKSGHHQEALEGWSAHPAYVFGNERLSCALCILGSQNDLINGMQHNPDLYQELVEMEKTSGWKFRQDLALSALAAY